MNYRRNIFKKSNIDQQIDRPDVLFSVGKYCALDRVSYAKFSAYYTINNKPDHSSEYQPDEFRFTHSEMKKNYYQELLSTFV